VTPAGTAGHPGQVNVRSCPAIPASILRHRRGNAAEDLAAAYLGARGLSILARNVRCKGGEIDILCLDGQCLAVIEVRQRAHGRFGGALASVTPAKQRKIIRAARYLLQTSAGYRGRRMRFDVVGVEGLPESAHRISWIKDAFRTR
jgi:putative endonuclease